MVYSQESPYELLCNGLIGFPEMQRVRRFSKYWERVVNSGNYTRAAGLLLAGAGSAFWQFMRFSDWAFAVLGRTDSIGQRTWADTLCRYLTEELGVEPEQARETLVADLARTGSKELPKEWNATSLPSRQRSHAAGPPVRQQKHLPTGDDQA